MATKPVPSDSVCYACDAPATTWEHAPPKGFYPKPRETFRGPRGPNYRTKLIVVPSCAEHNNARNKDDAYTMGMVVLISAAFLGTADLSPFVERWIERASRGRRLRETLYDSARHVITTDGPKVAITIDIAAVDRVMEASARALYYHEHEWQKRWPDRCTIRNPDLVQSDGSAPPDARTIATIDAAFPALNERDHDSGTELGPHPDVFYYQLAELPDGPVMRLVFYRVFRFVAVGVAPPQ